MKITAKIQSFQKYTDGRKLIEVGVWAFIESIREAVLGDFYSSCVTLSDAESCLSDGLSIIYEFEPRFSYGDPTK